MSGLTDGRFDTLHGEAAAALASSANVLRDVRARYRQAYAEELERWQELNDGDAGERERVAGDLGREQAELRRLELAERNLESTWLFLERGDASLVGDERQPASETDLQMRIVE